MTVTLSHMWAIQTLRGLDMSQPIASVQLLRIVMILCPDLTPKQIWSEISYEDLLKRLHVATAAVIASLKEQQVQDRQSQHWSVWTDQEVDAA